MTVPFDAVITGLAEATFPRIDIRSVPVVVARAVPAAVAVRAAVVRPAVVAVRATVVPDVVAARDEPPVVRAAAARVAAVVVAVRVAVVVPVARGDAFVVPRDATARDASVRADVVVRAATTRDEFPAAVPRPDDFVPDVAGTARDAVVLFATGVAFTGAREIFTGADVSGAVVSAVSSTIPVSGIIKKPFSSYIASAYSSAPSSVMKTGATSANAGNTSSPPTNIASRFMVKISFLCVKFIIL